MVEIEGALGGLTVLDISGALGNYAAKLFAELGADVILVEPFEGSRLRSAPPFDSAVDGPSASLRFAAYNTSKQSLCVDFEQPAGRDVIIELARKSDLVIEDRPPGELDSRGFGPSQLRAANPRLVVTSVSPFGQSGPYATYDGSDLVCLALGGLLSLSGSPDGPPLRPAGEQAYAAGNLFAAVASMVALTNAEHCGEGQHVDVSVQEAVAVALENAGQFYFQEGRIRQRLGAEQRQAGYGVFRCADGFVVLIAGGLGGNRFWGNLVKWLESCSFNRVDALRAPQWADRDFLLRQEAKDEFRDIFEDFTASRTKADLYTEAQSWRVPLCPVNAISEMLGSEQLAYRKFLTSIVVNGRTAVAPGAPYSLSVTPWRSNGVAPGLGEHTDAVLGRFGWTSAAIQALRVQGAVR